MNSIHTSRTKEKPKPQLKKKKKKTRKFNNNNSIKNNKSAYFQNLQKIKTNGVQSLLTILLQSTGFVVSIKSHILSLKERDLKMKKKKKEPLMYESKPNSNPLKRERLTYLGKSI